MSDRGCYKARARRLHRGPRGVLLLGMAWVVIAAGPAAAGSITGTVRFAGAVVEPKKLPVTVNQAVCGTEKDAESIVLSPQKGIRNVVVSLQTPPPDATWTTPRPRVQLDQRQCVFIPHVVIVPVGGTVEFLNSDRLLHNIRTHKTTNPAFNRTQPKGRTIPIAFNQPEIIRVDCDLHPWMRTWVVVAEHPFFALTNERGEFVLDNVPPGRYTLQIWQETLGTVTRDVTVGDGVTAVTVEMREK